MFEMGAKLKSSGVKLGVGTDLVVDWHRHLPEAYIHELRNFRRLGHSAPEALIAATRTNAEYWEWTIGWAHYSRASSPI